MSKNEKRQIRILVKAFPQHSTKYEETVCCAGITEDTQELLRLYPIRFRRLDKTNQFKRYDRVEMTITKASDPRPESYRVDENSIHIIDGKKLPDDQKVKLWRPHIAPSLKSLLEESKNTHRSLGIIKPDPGSLRFSAKPAKDSNEDDQAVASLVFEHQMSMLEEPLKPLDKPKYSFYYQYTCDGHRHNQQIHDWEVQATFINYRRQYGSEAAGLERMREMYQETMPNQNLHFIMGNMAARHHIFIIIGLLRTGLDPEELDKQGELF